MYQQTGFYRGTVSHHRVQPRRHNFEYQYFYFWLCLDQLAVAQHQQPGWFSRWPGWAKFKRHHYFGEHLSLADDVRKVAKLGCSSGNQVYMLGQLAYWGVYFSPVNFYFIGEPGRFHTLVAEVSNTPWDEKHTYVVPLNEMRTQGAHQHRKCFHVSPFMSSQQNYHWRVKITANEIAINIESSEQNTKMFNATLNLQPVPLGKFTFPIVLSSTFGWMFSAKLKIYWQALKLFIKRMPFYSHSGLHGNQNHYDTGEDYANKSGKHRWD